MAKEKFNNVMSSIFIQHEYSNPNGASTAYVFIDTFQESQMAKWQYIVVDVI